MKELPVLTKPPFNSKHIKKTFPFKPTKQLISGIKPDLGKTCEIYCLSRQRDSLYPWRVPKNYKQRCSQKVFVNTSILFIESTSQGRKKITHLTESYSLNEKLQRFIIFQLEGTTPKVFTKPARQDLQGRTQHTISTEQKKGKHQTSTVLNAGLPRLKNVVWKSEKVAFHGGDSLIKDVEFVLLFNANISVYMNKFWNIPWM